MGATIAPLQAQVPSTLGDLDQDGVATVRDIAVIAGHFNGTTVLSESQRQFADVNRDGAINDADMDELVKEILGTREPETLPLATIRSTSPASGEGDVSVTRETIVHFTVPLAPTATLDTTKFKAEFGGKKILSRVDVASDRKKATLFYLEPLPSNARVQITLDGGGLTDLLNRPFDADGDGLPGGTWTGSFDTLSISPVQATAIVGRVFASQRGTGGGEVPLAGVTVTVDGAEQTLRTTTDAQGNFSLSPCPAGSFFVQVDGRTSPQSSYPNGSYYPFVGKRWEAEPGRTDNLCGNSQDTVRGTVYLPLITSGTMTTTSQVHDTKVVFPASVLAANPLLAGTEINVPANSLFADGGARGGRVGIAPVAPDRLPSPLPPGLNLPLVITIQTDGASNFDRPVPVSFPNLPDPLTGWILQPHEKSALWSFNHDLGEWEIVGPMTVSDDGLFVKTDAGIGILQPGWHGTQPGCQQNPSDTKDGPKPDDKCPDPNNRDQVLNSPYRKSIIGPAPPPNACTLSPDGFPILDQRVDFTDACNNHDLAYGTYVDAANFVTAKASADRQFLADLTKACDQAYTDGRLDSNEWEQCRSRAQTYFKFVNIAGRKFYFDAQFEASVLDCPSPRTQRFAMLAAGFGPAPLRHELFYSVFDLFSDETIFRGKTGGTGLPSPMILRNDTAFMYLVFDPVSGRTGSNTFLTGANGSRGKLRETYLFGTVGADADADGIGDDAESILGTDAASIDSDHDGISDGAEVKQGTNPLDGVIVSTGVIASAPTGGPAVDVSALNNIAATANGAAGITLFNVLSGLNPVRLQEIDTPGTAVAVAIQGERIAVADYTAGLAIVDVSSPANAAIVQQVNLGSPATSVITYGPVAFVGAVNGTVTAVDLRTGAILWRIVSNSGQVQDLAVVDQTLYAYRVGRVDVIPVDTAVPSVVGTVTVTGGVGAGSRRLRLGVGPGVLYAAHTAGWNVLDIVTNPRAPVVVAQRTTGQFGFKQLVSTGSSLAVAAASPNSTSDGPHDIDLYDAGANGRGNSFFTTLVTPGLAEALSIYNGLAYVADGSSGLQVVNYRAYDNLGVAPTITLTSNFNLAGVNAEEGALMRLTAQVGDDVQVRNVEFYLDGVLVATDGNFPFEYRFVTPAIAAGKSSFTVRARATDTGGNATWTSEHSLNLVTDATPPTAVRFQPANGALVSETVALAVGFNEPMNLASLSSGGITLVSAGPDTVFGNADDVTVAGSSFDFVLETLTAYLVPSSPLTPGLYRLKAAAPASDAAGNAMTSSASSSFRIASPLDTDGDGLPDDWEVVLGLNPGLTDSNGNGILDGAEDYDNDGLRNSWEIILNRDPRLRDSDGNGIDDGKEDLDNDGLKDPQELMQGTDPGNPDTDSDGFDDSSEVAGGTDPLSPGSRPSLEVSSSQLSFLNAVGESLPPEVEAFASMPVTYLNTVGESLPPEVEAFSSFPVIFLNATDPPIVPKDAYSPQIIYRNNPPP